MPFAFIVFLITNPFSISVYLIIVEIIFKVTSCFLKTDWTKGFKWRLIFYAVLLLVSIIVNFRMLFTNDYCKSLVDVSPITELTNEQIKRLETVIEDFKEYEFINRGDVKEMPNHPFLYKTYNFGWWRQEPRSLVDVSMSFYQDEQRAIEDIKVFAYGEKYTLITNDNNTEAVLYDSMMLRSEFFPTPDRLIVSEIRLGNVQILLLENREQDQLDMNVSSDFVEWLCKILTE